MTTKDQITEIRLLAPGGSDVSLVSQGDKFTARLERGPDGNAMAADGASFEEALDKIIERLRGRANINAQGDAELNLARTEAQMATQLGTPSAFQRAILAGKSLDEARAEAAAESRGAEPEGPASAPAPAQQMPPVQRDPDEDPDA